MTLVSNYNHFMQSEGYRGLNEMIKMICDVSCFYVLYYVT
uniref:Uncharacterized protein n=1 Tax=Anguilla anguilla TaxID=7936 RepID=A0A0E9WFW1_ANGAN